MCSKLVTFTQTFMSQQLSLRRLRFSILDVQHLSQLLYYEKREELLKEHVTKPSFYFAHFTCGKVILRVLLTLIIR